MTTEQNSIPSQNDKIMAALAHISAVLPFMGVIAPIVIWATQKDFRYMIIGNRPMSYLNQSS